MQQNVRLSDIIPPGPEYSYDPEEFSRLKESIKTNGLFHPIIIQGDNPPYKIIAGRARFNAIKESNSGPTIVIRENHSSIDFFNPDQFIQIPATILPANCPNPLEIALEENLRRDNLNWYEQVELELQYHNLKVQEHGEKPKSGGRPARDETRWSQNDSARALGLSVGTLSQDINLALALKKNPHLRNVKDKVTALKVIKQIVKREVAEIEQMAPADIEMNEVYLGDSADILVSFPNNTFDCCITDPPWSEYKDEELRSDQDRLLPIFFQLFRVLKSNSFLFIITSTTDFYFYKKELPKLGFRVQSYPILWQKPKTITHGRAPWQYARDYEPIIVAVKGNPSLTSGVELSSILKYDNLHYTKMIHPHEKPPELIKELLKNSTSDGAKVIDVFAGSGVVLESCKQMDRKYIGIEKDKKFYDNIVRRLK
jgi:DNA modification methylase